VKLREATGGSNSPANSLQPHNARRDVGGDRGMEAEGELRKAEASIILPFRFY